MKTTDTLCGRYSVVYVNGRGRISAGYYVRDRATNRLISDPYRSGYAAQAYLDGLLFALFASRNRNDSSE